MPTVVRLLATWPAVEASVPRPRWLEHQWTAEVNWSERWFWLWHQRFPEGPPWAVWAEAAGVSLEYREDTMERMRFLRVIYPDGAIASMAKRLLGDRLIEEFRTAQRRLAQRAK